MALALQGALLVRHAPGEVADAFCASRLTGEGDRVFGTLPTGLEFEKIIDRARPAAS
jgi:putative acyl-CoA dehydrogenase